VKFGRFLWANSCSSGLLNGQNRCQSCSITYIHEKRYPDKPHFHTALKEVNAESDSNNILLAVSSETAIGEDRLRTENGWVVSVEFYDDETDNPSDMTLFDFFKD
jgi:hypothetical protein